MKHITPLLFSLALTAGTTAQAQAPSAGIDRANMDTSVRPGTDFYQYATGGWIKAHPLTSEFSRYAQFDVLRENSTRQIRELIEELSAAHHSHGSIEQKIGSLYRLSMDSVRRNKEDFAPIRTTLARVEGITKRQDVLQQMAVLSAQGIPGFFAFGCDADLKHARMNLMQVSQGGISMGERDYYLANDEATKHIRQAYREYVKSLFLMTGKSDAEATESMEGVLRIETRIAQASKSAVQLRDTEANYHKMSYADLLSRFSVIDWHAIFTANHVPAFDSITVNQPEAIEEVERVLKEGALNDLKAYLYFKVCDHAANALSDRFREASFRFYSQTMGGAQADRPRWKRAVSAVESAMSMAVGRLYVEKYFPQSSKQRMVELVHNLQTALGERIDRLTWMSAETKKRAHDKLATFYVKVGYPDKWMDYSALDIDETLSFYDNMVRVAQFHSNYYIQTRVNRPVDRTEWLMSPQTVNAYYNPTTNEICFPAAILQPPFFNAEADDACNYGGIGAVIGHEMTHGFDDQGALFDKDGNLHNWWTSEDKEKFDRLTGLLAQHYDSLEALPGLTVNGRLTLGENIADLGGVNVAYQAYRHTQQTQQLETKDGFTPDQRFFLNYASLWAWNVRDELVRQYVRTNPHSPNPLRVNGLLPHIDAWYDAFAIVPTEPLYLPADKRVHIW